MSHQPSAALLDLEYGDDPASTFLSDRYHQAVDQLHRAYNSSRPLAIMVGEGPAAASTVIASLLGRLSEDVTTIRIDEPCGSGGISGLQLPKDQILFRVVALVGVCQEVVRCALQQVVLEWRTRFELPELSFEHTQQLGRVLVLQAQEQNGV